MGATKAVVQGANTIREADVSRPISGYPQGVRAAYDDRSESQEGERGETHLQIVLSSIRGKE